MLAFGRYVRERRARRDLTQTELGAAVGLTHSGISKIERGKQKSIGYALLRDLAGALGEPEDVLAALLYDRPPPRGLRPFPEPGREVPVIDTGIPTKYAREERRRWYGQPGAGRRSMPTW